MMLLPLLLLTALPADPPCPAWQALQRYTISAGPGAQEQFAAQELRRWLGNLTAGTVATGPAPPPVALVSVTEVGSSQPWPRRAASRTLANTSRAPPRCGI